MALTYYVLLLFSIQIYLPSDIIFMRASGSRLSFMIPIIHCRSESSILTSILAHSSAIKRTRCQSYSSDALWGVQYFDPSAYHSIASRTPCRYSLYSFLISSGQMIPIPVPTAASQQKKCWLTATVTFAMEKVHGSWNSTTP